MTSQYEIRLDIAGLAVSNRKFFLLGHFRKGTLGASFSGSLRKAIRLVSNGLRIGERKYVGMINTLSGVDDR